VSLKSKIEYYQYVNSLRDDVHPVPYWEFCRRIVSNTRKFVSGLSRLLHDELHWLDIMQTEYESSSPCWCIGVFMERLRCTWWTAAHQAPTFLVVSICGPPVSGSWSFRVIIWTVSVVGVLLSRTRRPGIRYLTVFTVSSRHVFVKYWRNVLSTSFDNVLYKFTLYLLTCLLIYARIAVINHKQAYKIWRRNVRVLGLPSNHVQFRCWVIYKAAPCAQASAKLVLWKTDLGSWDGSSRYVSKAVVSSYRHWPPLATMTMIRRFCLQWCGSVSHGSATPTPVKRRRNLIFKKHNKTQSVINRKTKHNKWLQLLNTAGCQGK